MLSRLAAAALAAAAVLTLTATACSVGSSSDGKAAPPHATPTSAGSTGTPSQSAELSDLTVAISGLSVLNPALASDPAGTAKLIHAQCAILKSHSDPNGHVAAQRFSDHDHPLTDEQGLAADQILLVMACGKTTTV
jgi:hypothetical protein